MIKYELVNKDDKKITLVTIDCKGFEFEIEKMLKRIYSHMKDIKIIKTYSSLKKYNVNKKEIIIINNFKEEE